MGYVTVAHYCYRGVLVEAELRLKALPRPRPDGVTLATRAAAAGCSGTAVGVDVLPSVGFEADRFLKCRQYTHCPAPKAVMWCVFDGLHADWPYGLEDLVWWFFKKAVG